MSALCPVCNAQNPDGRPGCRSCGAPLSAGAPAAAVHALPPGTTLQGGPLSEREAVAAIEQVGAALAVVHQASLLHRDLKPENVMVTEEGRVVLVDFGTAREFAAGKTKRMTTLLTPGYAPLEQYGQQARFGAFTDVYALGAMLYHLLTGAVPVVATDRAAGVMLAAPHR